MPLSMRERIKKSEELTLDDVLEIIGRVEDKMLANKDIISYSMLLVDEGCSRSRMQFWIDHYTEVVSAVARLKDVREARYRDLLLERNDGTQIAGANLQFYGKCCLKMIDHATERKLSIEEGKIDKLSEAMTDKDAVIKIGFDV